ARLRLVYAHRQLVPPSRRRWFRRTDGAALRAPVLASRPSPLTSEHFGGPGSYSQAALSLSVGTPERTRSKFVRRSETDIMPTRRLAREMAWLVAASVASTAACGSSNKDDDDDPPASVGTTGTFPSGNTSNGNTSGFNNSGFNNGNTGTTGNMIDQMNDNCVGI